MVKKFRDEGDAARIQHPGVVTVLDKGALPSGAPYLVMEFIEGPTLRQVIKAHQAEDRQMAFSELAEIVK